VVIPPPCLIDEHGQLGHTLLSGPLHRHSQRIIMLYHLIAFIYSSVLMASTVEGVELGTSNIITGGTCCKCAMYIYNYNSGTCKVGEGKEMTCTRIEFQEQIIFSV